MNLNCLSGLRFLSFGLLTTAALVFAGCSGGDQPTAEANPVSSESGEHEGHDHEGHDHDGHDHDGDVAAHGAEHGGWWCGEHGVPEAKCAQCDKSLVAEFKEKGDWCEKHNRPESQCFLCNPDNFDKFASLYEAKYGERPEMPTE